MNKKLNLKNLNLKSIQNKKQYHLDTMVHNWQMKHESEIDKIEIEKLECERLHSMISPLKLPEAIANLINVSRPLVENFLPSCFFKGCCGIQVGNMWM